MKTLKDAKIGENLRVTKIHGEGAVKRRIMDMRGFELSLRKADAQIIEVE